MNIRLLKNLVAIRRNPVEETTSGIVLPNADKDSKGVVVAVGPGMHINDKYVPTVVNVGDEVVFQKDVGEELEINGENLLVISEMNIIGILN